MSIKCKGGEIHSVIRFFGASIGCTRCLINFPDSMKNWEWVKKEVTCKKCLYKMRKMNQIMKNETKKRKIVKK